MTTATATKPARKLTSPRYPGWTIERLSATDYLMVRDAGIFAASVTFSEQWGWTAELLTKQRGSWEPARWPFQHCALGVVNEAERRARYIAKCERKPLTRTK